MTEVRERDETAEPADAYRKGRKGHEHDPGSYEMIGKMWIR